MLLLSGKVKNGKKRGSRLGFPTINIPVSRSVKKNQWGIYFSLVKLDGKIYPGATHLGPPRMFHLTPTCETYLLTRQGNLYGKQVEKRLLFKFRDIEEFSSVKVLRRQIGKDIAAAKRFFGL